MRITGGQWVNHKIAVPLGQGVRPTPDKVRQAIFNSLGRIEGASVLELFAGSGAQSGAHRATSAVAIEKARSTPVHRRNAR